MANIQNSSPLIAKLREQCLRRGAAGIKGNFKRKFQALYF